VVQVLARDRAGNEAATPAKVPPDRGETRGVPGLTIRAIAAEPPVHPVTAGSKVTINVDARGHNYHWSLRRLGTARIVARGKVKAQQTLRISASDCNSRRFIL